jgi:squalene synthase HpnC
LGTKLEKELKNKIFNLTRNHYENFPVVSLLIPPKLRKDVALVYWFARTADDMADEGDIGSDDRLKNLNDFEHEFELALKNKSNHKYFIALADTIQKRNLTPQDFFDLLSAFKQDIAKNRYNTFNELLDYCSRSANPVGKIILELNGIRNEDANKLSDKICTALQLTNFYQDTKIDYEKGRIYYPIDEMKKFNVTEKMFELEENNLHISNLVKHNIERTQLMFDEGEKLLNYLSGRLKLEIKWTLAGGEKILDKIRFNNYNVFDKRPQLSKYEYFSILVKSFFKDV